jgi:mannitol-1-/sugar-/sorbitol-6-phosphatase
MTVYIRGKAILFDMDGTLIDSNEASEATWQRWAASHQVPMEKIREVHHGRRPEETIAIVAPHLDVLKEAKVIYDAQESSMDGIHPILGANSFFQSVPKDRCALVTAATLKIVRLRFKVVGLEPPEVCVTSETLKTGKPSPEGYLQAAKRLGFAPAECIVFEDAPAGLIAAHRAGMPSIAIVSNYTEAELRKELGPEMAPLAFLPNFLGVSFADGTVTIPN